MKIENENANNKKFGSQGVLIIEMYLLLVLKTFLPACSRGFM